MSLAESEGPYTNYVNRILQNFQISQIFDHLSSFMVKYRFKFKIKSWGLLLKYPRGDSDDRYLIGLRGLIALRLTKMKTKQLRM